MRAAIVLGGLLVLAAVPATAGVDLRPGAAVVRAETAALLLSGQRGGALPLAAAAAPVPAGDVDVTVLIEIDGPSLLAGGPAMTTDVFVYAMSSAGEVLATAARRVELDADLHRERLAGAGLRVVLGLDLPPGEHDVRVLARVASGALGLARVPVAVPEPGAEASGAGTVIPALRPSPGWVTAVTAGDEAALGAAWTERGLAEPWTLSSLTDATAAETVPPELLPPAAPTTSREALHRRDLATGYLEVLRRLAAGDRDAALGALYELETRALANLDAEDLADLERAQADTLRAVTKSSPLALLPVVQLHADAVRGYRTAGRAALVAHSETAVTDLARAYAERVDRDAARCDAVRLLAGLAAEMRRLGTLTRAAELYRQALDVDPGHPAVALSLAAIHEWLGRYAEAVTTLEAIETPSPEARLRLAVNLLRTRRVDRARRLLRDLARGSRGSEDDWTRRIAVEELVRLELARDAPGAAAEILRRAGDSGRHPTLDLQRAFVLDRLGRRDEAVAIAAEIARGASRGDSERSRYNRWPPVDLEACPERTERLAAGREALARALAGGRR